MTLSQAGGHSSIHQSVANEAPDVWRGYEPGTPGSRTCNRFELLPTLFQFLLFASMVVHDTSPKPFSFRLAAAERRFHLSAFRKHCSTILFWLTLAPFRSLTLLLNVAIESN